MPNAPHSIECGAQVQVDIESLSSDGSAIGRLDNLVLFVENGCPGDKLKVEITEKRPSFLRAKIVEILRPSKSRITPKCSVFPRCGGCDWQHVKYATQLEQKRSLIEQSLRMSGLGKWNHLVAEVTPSPNQFAYRNRIQVHRKAGQNGYFARKSADLVSITECPIAEPEISLLIPNISGADGAYQIANSLSGEVSISPRENFQSDFSQVNSSVNELMLAYVETVFSSQVNGKIEMCYDLYSGNGNVGIHLAKKYSEIEFHLVELGESSHQRSAENSAHLSNCRAIRADVEHQLSKYFSFENGVVIVDPPRAGLSRTTSQLLGRLLPQSIIYISCDSATLSRDINRLLNYGYNIQSIQPFDMFPQTAHVESVTLLTATGTTSGK